MILALGLLAGGGNSCSFVEFRGGETLISAEYPVELPRRYAIRHGRHIRE
jgi:hypothetical protein